MFCGLGCWFGGTQFPQTVENVEHGLGQYKTNNEQQEKMITKAN